jgi:hypothetical protein
MSDWKQDKKHCRFESPLQRQSLHGPYWGDRFRSGIERVAEALLAVRRDRLIEARGPIVAERSEQRAGIVSAVTGRVEIVVDQALGRLM